MQLLKTLKLTQYQRSNANNPYYKAESSLLLVLLSRYSWLEIPTINKLVYTLLRMIVVNYVKLKWANGYCVGGVWVRMVLSN